jgi:hypothetical protein
MCLAFMVASSLSQASEFTIRPSIAISQEYSDNIDQVRDKRSGFTTRIRPGITASYKAPVWEWDFNYSFEYSRFSTEREVAGRERERQDISHTLSAQGLVNLIENLFYLQVSNVYERVDLDVVRAPDRPHFFEDADQDVQDPILFVDDIRIREVSDRNVFSLSPYFTFKPTARTSLHTGYRYTNTWYKEDIARDRQAHQVFANVGYQATLRWNLNAGYSTIWESIQEGNDPRREYRHNVFIGTAYQFAPASNVFGRIGTTWREQEGRETTRDLFWNAGLRHALNRYILSLSTGVRYVDDPLQDRVRKETIYAAGLTRPYARGTAALTASYSRFDVPSATRYLAGATLNHYLTRRLMANVGLFAARRRTDNQPRVEEWRTLLGLRYLLMREMFVSLNYQYTDSSSQDPLSDDNFQENRVNLEVRKTF